MLQEPGRALNLRAANQNGQQLYFANMRFQARRKPLVDPVPPLRAKFRPLPWQQLPLFELPLGPAQVRQRAYAADTSVAHGCDHIVRDHADRHGWTQKHTYDVRRSLRMLHVLQHTPGARSTPPT